MTPEQYRVLLDEAQDKIVVLDDDGVYRWVNGAVRRLLGYEPETLVGEESFSFMHPDDQPDVRAAFEAVAVEGAEPQGIEYRHRTAGGEWVWLESRMADHSNSAVGGYVVSSRDVTEQKEAERARERTETRLQEIAGNTSEVLWMFDGDWSEVLFVNDAFEDLWGMSVEQLESGATAFIDGVHPDDRRRVRDAMARLSAGEHVDIEYRVNPGMDYRRWVWVRGAPIVEDGEVVRITGFAREITDRRRRERQLQVMDRLLRHNLRNELNIVIGRAELAAEVGPPEVREHAAAIDRICRSVLATAEKEREIVTVLSAPEATAPVDLARVGRDAVESVRDTWEGVDISIDAPESAMAAGVPSVDLALAELVENAVAHADGQRVCVDVDVEVGEGTVAFTVRDVCPKIPPEDANVLLGDRDVNALSHGSGLGLWLVHWTVELSDGTISLARREEGNVVTVTLPRSADAT